MAPAVAIRDVTDTLTLVGPGQLTTVKSRLAFASVESSPYDLLWTAMFMRPFNSSAMLL